MSSALTPSARQIPPSVATEPLLWTPRSWRLIAESRGESGDAGDLLVEGLACALAVVVESADFRGDACRLAGGCAARACSLPT